jgi:membrane-bound ClpP family serine protease
MTLILLLFALGILFLAIEVIIPGGILGGFGVILMFLGCWVSFDVLGTLGGIGAITIAIMIGILTMFLEFWVFPRTQMGKKAFLTKEITAVSVAVGEEALLLVGQTAEALTMLSPSGYVQVNGQRYEAFSQSGQVPVGSYLKIIGADSFRLIVSLDVKL